MEPNEGLTGLFSNSPDQIALVGSPETLKALAEQVRSGDADLTLAPNGSPEPYQGFLAAIQIRSGEGPLEIRCLDGRLIATGALESLACLADTIELLLDEPQGHHVHFEHYPGHPHISANATPLVISLTAAGD